MCLKTRKTRKLSYNILQCVLGYKWSFNNTHCFRWNYSFPVRLAKGIYGCKSDPDEHGNFPNISPRMPDLCRDIQVTRVDSYGKC